MQTYASLKEDRLPGKCYAVRLPKIYTIKKYLHGKATMGKTTHKKTLVIPSAGDPANLFFTHKG
jgi:hypothetical protein